MCDETEVSKLKVGKLFRFGSDTDVICSFFFFVETARFSLLE